MRLAVSLALILGLGTLTACDEVPASPSDAEPDAFVRRDAAAVDDASTPDAAPDGSRPAADAEVRVDAGPPPEPPGPGDCTDVTDGWFDLTPPSEDAVVYVSADGDDTNAGTLDRPVATVERALERMRAGRRWMLLRRGDTFEGQLGNWPFSGASESDRVVVGAYGDLDEPRPVFIPPGGVGSVLLTNGGGGMGDTPVEHVSFVGIDFYAAGRDPDHPSFIGLGEITAGDRSVAFQFLRPLDDVVFEDVRIRFFNNAINLQAPRGGNVTIRRSVIVDQYGDHEQAHSQGVFVSPTVHGLLIEDSVFDHNGWNEELASRHATVGLATQFNHNLYLTGYDVTLRNNVLARASANGFQMRGNGVAHDNLLLANPVAGFVAGDQPSPGGRQVLSFNVVLHGATRPLENGQPRGWGLNLNPTCGCPEASSCGGWLSCVDPSEFDEIGLYGNVVAHGGQNSALTRSDGVPAIFRGVATVRDNVTWNWGSDTDSSGSHPDPSRNIETYQAHLGGAGSIDAFMARAREQRRGHWCREYTAETVNRYVRAGFDVPTP